MAILGRLIATYALGGIISWAGLFVYALAMCILGKEEKLDRILERYYRLLRVRKEDVEFVKKHVSPVRIIPVALVKWPLMFYYVIYAIFTVDKEGS